jgi:hypothetical protein
MLKRTARWIASAIVLAGAAAPAGAQLVDPTILVLVLRHVSQQFAVEGVALATVPRSMSGKLEGDAWQYTGVVSTKDRYSLQSSDGTVIRTGTLAVPATMRGIVSDDTVGEMRHDTVPAPESVVVLRVPYDASISSIELSEAERPEEPSNAPQPPQRLDLRPYLADVLAQPTSQPSSE